MRWDVDEKENEWMKELRIEMKCMNDEKYFWVDVNAF